MASTPIKTPENNSTNTNTVNTPVFKLNENQTTTYLNTDYPDTVLVENIDEKGNPIYIITKESFLYRGGEKITELDTLAGIKWYALKLIDTLTYGPPTKMTASNDITILAIDKLTVAHPFYHTIQNDNDAKNAYSKFFKLKTDANTEETYVTRDSIPENDYALAAFICNNGYSGYGMNSMPLYEDFIQNEFHSEIALQDGNKLLGKMKSINMDFVRIDSSKEDTDESNFIKDVNGHKVTNNTTISTLNHLNSKKDEAENNKNKRNKRNKRNDRTEGNKSQKLFAPPLSLNSLHIDSRSPYGSPSSPERSPPKFSLVNGGKNTKKIYKKKINKNNRKTNKRIAKKRTKNYKKKVMAGTRKTKSKK